MRLTLRTLLAYLDNTLSPADAEVLRNKLTESGFATALVARIRKTISRPDLGAAPPTAVDPVNDANAVSEYLDSTMSAEQIAEIERATLESDQRLAETAACHQILTMVLGQPAVVSEPLRRRVHSLGDASITHEQTATPSPSSSPSAIEPLGRTDSGVSDAPSRILGAEIAGTADASSSLDPPSTGGRPSSGEKSLAEPADGNSQTKHAAAQTSDEALDPLSARASLVRQRRQDFETGGDSSRWFRPLRYAFAVGTLAFLIFALVQVFRPLIDGDRVAMQKVDPPTPISAGDSGDPAAVDAPPIAAEQMVDKLLEDISEDLANQPPGTVDDGEMAEKSSMAEKPLMSAKEKMMGGEKEMMNAKTMDNDSLAMAEKNASMLSPADGGNPVQGEVAQPSEVAPTDNVADMDAKADAMSADAMSAAANEIVGVDSSAASEKTLQPPAADSADVAPDDSFIIRMVAKQPATLLIGRIDPVTDGDNPADRSRATWGRVTPTTIIESNQTLVVPSKFQAAIRVSPDIVVSAIGPAELVVRRMGETPVVELDYGRMVVESDVQGGQVILDLAKKRVVCTFEKPDSVVAISAVHQRERGMPLTSGQRAVQVSMLVTKGTVQWAIQPVASEEAMSGTSSSPEGWTQRTRMTLDDGLGGDSVDGTDVSNWIFERDPIVPIERQPPQWASDAGPSVAANVDSLAREGLLSQINEDKPLEISLREATAFRRPEVSALAGQALLTMGRAEVYFGVDGLLAHDDQRTYWNDHYRLLTSMIDRGPATAVKIIDDIRRMDSAGEPIIRRLLRGYSQADLAAGGDAELVAALNSPSMPIRVLAIENLFEITGKKLFFRPEHETEAKREAAIKAWQAWLRRGDIRWSGGDS